MMTLNTFVAASGLICPGFYRGMRVSFITTSLFCWVRSLCLLTKLTALSTTVALDTEPVATRRRINEAYEKGKQDALKGG